MPTKRIIDIRYLPHARHLNCVCERERPVKANSFGSLQDRAPRSGPASGWGLHLFPSPPKKPPFNLPATASCALLIRLPRGRYACLTSASVPTDSRGAHFISSLTTRSVRVRYDLSLYQKGNTDARVLMHFSLKIARVGQAEDRESRAHSSEALQDNVSRFNLAHSTAAGACWPPKR